MKGELIGKGSYGRVYIALNVNSGDMMAVKQVELPATERDRNDRRQLGMIEALRSEIALLKDLYHPNIVAYLGGSLPLAKDTSSCCDRLRDKSRVPVHVSTRRIAREMTLTIAVFSNTFLVEPSPRSTARLIRRASRSSSSSSSRRRYLKGWRTSTPYIFGTAT